MLQSFPSLEEGLKELREATVIIFTQQDNMLQPSLLSVQL